MLMGVNFCLYAADYYWDFVDALSKNEVRKVEQILKDNAPGMTESEKRLVYIFALNYSRRDNALAILELLERNNIRPVQYDLYNAINTGHRDNVIEFLLSRGMPPNGEILLAAAQARRFNLVRQFAAMGADVNYRYPDDKSYADGMTALLWAVKWNDIETVRLLAKHGANVNVRAKNGDTPLSLAIANGRSDIYNCLRENGADENLTPPPARPAGSVAGGNSPSLGYSGGIGGFIETGSMPFRTGTYRLSGGNTEMKFTGNDMGGTLYYRNSRGGTGTGYYTVNGNIMTVVMGYLSFLYNVDSAVSFSGNGETWIWTRD
jgi:ankyrin repeat protein